MRLCVEARRLQCLRSLFFVTAVARGDAIDDYVAERMRELRLPGVALAVVREGEVLAMRSYGSVDLELDVPVSEDTVFEIGSVTKQFTAAAIMMLVEDGKVRLDDSIGKHLPQLPASWRRITVRHLLTHSSGIQEYLSVPGLPEQAHAAASHDEMTRLFTRRLKLEFAPGETWSYSNSGYLLLGNIMSARAATRIGSFCASASLRPSAWTPPGAAIRAR
jgi:CubicO group peptidase (beta-lactamase class C family)